MEKVTGDKILEGETRERVWSRQRTPVGSGQCKGRGGAERWVSGRRGDRGQRAKQGQRLGFTRDLGTPGV